jgi:hypothetical protein
MADITITVGIPDGQLAEFYDSLRFKYGLKSDGTQYTNAELRALLKDEVRGNIKKNFRAYKKSLNADLNVT